MNLTFLLYLACPVGMGVMMWMMMRNNDQPQTKTPIARPIGDLTGLHQQLQSLESQQASIMAEIQRLRAEESSRGFDSAPETTSPLRTSPESEA